MSRDILFACVVFTTISSAACGGDDTAEAVDRTVATVEPVRSSVTVGSEPAVPVSRIAPGDSVETSEAGLVRVSLDSGATLLVGDAGRIVVNDADDVELSSGRLFATTEGGGRLGIHTARGRIGTSDGALSVRVIDDAIAVYVVRGEVGFSVNDSNGVVRAGEQLFLRMTKEVGSSVQRASIGSNDSSQDWPGFQRAAPPTWARPSPRPATSSIQNDEERSSISATVRPRWASSRPTTSSSAWRDCQVMHDSTPWLWAPPPTSISCRR